MIKLINLAHSKKEVRFNSKILGHFIMQEDGFYVFCAQNSVEGWSSYSLKLVADKLDEINKAFEKEINLYFGEKKKE